jgi:DNA repair exonuclease SbcCD nuclease subunit
MLEIQLMSLLEPRMGNVSGNSSFLVIPGNHDLPYHNMEYLPRSSLGVLAAGKYVRLIHDQLSLFMQDGKTVGIYGIPWGTDFHAPDYEKLKEDEPDLLIGVWHGMVTHGGTVPGSVEAEDLLCKFPEYDLIVTGHNHAQFVVGSVDGGWLVNPGGMMREEITMIDYEPAVFIYDTEHPAEIQSIPIPIEKNVISLDHKTEIEERDERIAVFVEQMKTEHDVGLSFEKNLQAHFAANKTPKDVEQIVWEVV